MKTWVVLIVFFASAGIVAAADQQFTGKVERVNPAEKKMILNVADGVGVEGKQVTILVDHSTRFQGAEKLSDLKEGGAVQAKARKSWFSKQWIAERLVYSVPKAPAAPSPTENAQLDQIENQFAHGQMGDVEFETKRQAMEESGTKKTF